MSALSTSERWLLACVVAGALIGLCVIGLVAAPWSSNTDEDAARPQWVTTETVRATTRDGKIVKAKMALDAPDSETRAWLNDRSRQVAMLMQISVSEHDAGNVSGSQRVQRLAEEMEERVNDMLAASRLPPVREVVIQDLVISSP